MKVLFIYRADGKKKSFKQVYHVDEETVVPLNGPGEAGHPLIFFPEGIVSNSYISAVEVERLRNQGEITGYDYNMYLLN